MNGEMIIPSYPPTRDQLRDIKWKTAEGEIIPISRIADEHLRNIALFLMGMGYRKCIANNEIRIAWLTVLRMEWERRQLTGKKIWRANHNETSTTNQESQKALQRSFTSD